MDSLQIYLILSILFAIGNIILSIVYFITIKEIWRYIKLWYIVTNAIVLVVLVETFLGFRPSGEMQIFGLILLLSSQFGGLVVSISKVQKANFIVEQFQKVKEELDKF